MPTSTASLTSLAVQTIDLTTAEGRGQLGRLVSSLSSQGDVVSPSAAKRTIEIFGEPLTPKQVVARICEDVQAKGREAVLEYSRRIDRAEVGVESLFVTAEAFEQAHASVAPAFLETVRRVRARVERFQQAVLPKDATVALPGGGSLRQRYLPLDRAGICIPGGAAAYPSSLLMTAVPAQVAGVREIVVVAPPTPFGSDNPHLLATCHELGLSCVMRAGGAQAVAALAYGIEGLARVDTIVGPGNLFVALAKQHVYGEVSIDSIAGPSEIVIVADASGSPEYIAADMLAQAEHSPGSAILLTSCRDLGKAVVEAVERRLAVLERAELTRESLERFSAVVITTSDAESQQLADELAAEHLSIDTADPEATLAGIRHAGAVFLGPYSPVAAGDYAAGPSHVLPTAATARFAAGLSATHFMRSGSVIHLSKADLAELADDIRTLADTEGLTAHRRSVDARLEA
ncbi:MAG: histidinol dehydrogenase [Pirellulales bacterium]|jgi:histidinol dehydrogenase|nr:histidinol dehydrogenase [Pirellulales bacterium]MBL7192465.1 histidinol dehydrogenase [Pirellulales bacterium]MDA0817473.1 histidinol dehydrogenase [Planctomycetota bacterium]